MPIVSDVEAKSLKGRLIHLSVFGVLLLGGLTMIYPFLIMLSGSIRSEVDQGELTLIPRYLVNSTWVYRKFLDTKYNQDIGMVMQAHNRPYFNFAQIPPPTPENEASKKTTGHPVTVQQRQASVADLRAFMNKPDLPHHWQRLGGIRGYETVPENLRELRQRVSNRFDGDIQALSQSLGSPMNSWLNIVLPKFDWLNPRFEPEDNVLYETYFAMLDEAPVGNRQLVSLSGTFLATVVFPTYGQISTERYNADHARPIERYTDFTLPKTVPGKDQPTLRAQWIEYVDNDLSAAFIGLADPNPADYRQFIRDHYTDTAELNKSWGTSIDGFDSVQLPQGDWIAGQQRLDYRTYLQTLPPESLTLMGPEFAYRDFLRNKYGSIDALRKAYGVEVASFEKVHPPMADLEYDYTLANVGSLRWAYFIRNYINVFDELIFQGRPLINTLIFVTLCVGLTLLINPLAAYAMSRFNLPGTYKVLLILMATTAFPPMVTLIPQFIVLREANLLNTIPALVLPFMINGYMVFLLKGFFDSLPQELYEAARIDGASEARMFFQITMSLSKPILAVLALHTFTAAYTAFLYPLLVAPDRDMWLISVWLYQFQQRSSSSAVFASVVIASIPTLAVFLFAQRTIMRGIVVPTEK